MDARAESGSEKIMGIWMSPINARRWRSFRANARGFWSLWIFLFLFTITLFSEFFANDRPILIRYDGSFYMPVLKTYAETEFGGEFELEADYRTALLGISGIPVIGGAGYDVENARSHELFASVGARMFQAIEDWNALEFLP